jgi:hypothetical protein
MRRRAARAASRQGEDGVGGACGGVGAEVVGTWAAAKALPVDSMIFMVDLA